MIQPKDILLIWQKGSADRLAMDRARSFYEGTNLVPELQQVRSDGRPKTHVRTNWTKYTVDQHTGFVTTKPVQYSTSLDDNSGIQYLYGLVNANDLDTLDTEHFANCLLYGQSVELHGFDGDRVTITQTVPYNWVFVDDAFGKTVAAIYKVDLAAGTMLNGALLTKPKSIFYHYDYELITEFEMNEKGELSLVSSKPHLFGTLPLVRFQAQKGYKPFLDRAFYSTCDNYDVIRSAQTDDIKYNVDSMMITKGVDFQALIEKDDKGITTLEKLRTMGILPVDATASVDWLTRNTDVEKFRFDLRVARASIHLMGCMPDLNDTINANGASPTVSGMALKLMFQSMIQKSGEFIKYFKRGLNSRIQLINNQSTRLGFPLITDYTIKLETNVPQSHIEWLQYLKNMEGIIPKFEIYKLLPFIDNPESTFEEYKAEQESAKLLPAQEEINTP